MRHLMNNMLRYPAYSSFLVTCFLFLLTTFVFTPLFNSGDDVFLMYTLSGGYGQPPTNLLHYNFGWHHWLGFFLKNLFVKFPSVNWYTLVLLCFHIAGCWSFLYVLLCRLKAGTALFIFIVLFFAGLLRFHITVLAMIVFLPLFFSSLAKKNVLRSMALMSGTVILLIFLYYGQRNFYIRNIPGWSQQERYRQALFFASNRPVAKRPVSSPSPDSLQRLGFSYVFFYDSLFLPAAKAEQIGRDTVRRRLMNEKEDWDALFWLFMEGRVYLVLFAVLIFLLWRQAQFFAVKKWVISAFIVLVVLAYIFVFQKITLAVQQGLEMILLMQMALLIKKETDFFTQSKFSPLVPAILFTLLFIWMGIRISKDEHRNKLNHRRFVCVVRELNQHSDELFVSTDDLLPLPYFYIWDDPKEFPLQNLIYKDMVLNHTYIQTLKRFDISDLISSMYQDKRIYLLGEGYSLMQPYYKIRFAKEVRISGVIPGYRCIQPRRLSLY